MLLASAAAACCALAAPSASAAPDAGSTGSYGGAWSWTADASRWAATNGALPAARIDRGPTTTVTRGQFLKALLRVEELRAQRGAADSRRLLEQPRPAPALADAAAGTARARAVAHGWMSARGGRFRAAAPITANDAALATAGMLGLRPQVVQLTRRLRAEVPGARVTAFSAAHALNRTLGLRYNVEDPNDELELGPTDALNVGHAAYMLHRAATGIESWKLDEARRLPAEFDLPQLGANQRAILALGLRQLGQPYIWGGETEGSQAEGKGGYDCSGFLIRVTNGAPVPAASISRILERTSFDQSDIPAGRRIAAADLQPADAMFFGDRGPRSTTAQNFHAGIYMGNGWFIHSSGGNGGVAINRLDGWWAERFSWGRRALLAP